jgi:hypothetical protein
MRDETADVYAQVHNRVDELLHYIWDPIGVAGTPEARDEYDSYVAGAVTMLFEGAAVDDLVRYLHSIETEAMGLTRFGLTRKETRHAAEVLVRSFRSIRDSDEARKRG